MNRYVGLCHDLAYVVEQRVKFVSQLRAEPVPALPIAVEVLAGDTEGRLPAPRVRQ